MDRKTHWENIYQTKQLKDVSWYQPKPETSLELIKLAGIEKTDAIIDIGGGDSFLVDHLLELGYTNISVLDISAAAIERAKERLGEKANKINWIHTDICDFNPIQSYKIWHDRAAFHFLKETTDVKKYIQNLAQATEKGSQLILGTFSDEGPLKCSGIEIQQYTTNLLSEQFKPNFETIKAMNVNHPTPFDTVQNFSFILAKKLA